MKLKWRKWFRVIHRDFGYLFFGMTIIYSLSGIALNHLNDWNPNYIVTTYDFEIQNPENITADISKDEVKALLETFGDVSLYKNHYFPNSDVLKIFLDGGSAYINLNSGQGLVERTVRRPVFREVNYLHYNPVKSWMWFSDVFAGALIILAITGLFLVRGKKGISGRGAWMTLDIYTFIIIFSLWYTGALIVSEKLGKKRKIGEEWSFAISFIFSPVVGLIVSLWSKNISLQKDR